MKPPNNMPTINLDALKKFNADLHQRLIDYLGLDESSSGEIQIAPTKWAGIPFRNDLIPFLQSQVKKEHEKYCGCEECFQKHVAEQNAGEKERLALVEQQKAAAARLIQYLRGEVAGVPGVLCDNEFNRNQWLDFDAKLPKDVAVTPELVDKFVAGYRNVLQWAAPTPAPAPTAEPAPEPVVLADGSPQKSLDETPSHNWTTAQLKDWFKRNDGQKLLRSQQFGGGSRSNFFKPDSQVV